MSSPDPDEIERLADEVSQQAKAYAASLRSQSNSPGQTTAQSLQDVQMTLINSTQELHDVVQTPVGYLRKELSGHCNLIGLHAIYRFRIHEKVPLNGKISYQDLAKLCDADEDKLRRIIRLAISRRIFREPHIGFVAHSPESRVIAADPFWMDYIGVLCEDMWPAAAMTVPAMVKWPHSNVRSHSGFALAYQSGTSLYDTLKIEPDRAARFSRFMKVFSSAPFLSYKHTAEAFDWSEVDTVVDVGGGSGHQAVVLAQRYPNLRCIVQDLDTVESEVSGIIPKEYRDRITWMPHDFFDEQPIRGADVYHFRWIFHDWPDNEGVLILRAIIPALKPNCKIIITDNLLPAPGSVSRVPDFVMMETNNAMERDIGQWQDLLGKADKRFELQEIKKVDGWRMACLVVVWKG